MLDQDYQQELVDQIQVRKTFRAHTHLFPFTSWTTLYLSTALIDENTTRITLETRDERDNSRSSLFSLPIARSSEWGCKWILEELLTDTYCQPFAFVITNDPLVYRLKGDF